MGYKRYIRYPRSSLVWSRYTWSRYNHIRHDRYDRYIMSSLVWSRSTWSRRRTSRLPQIREKLLCPLRQSSLSPLQRS